MTAPDHQTRCHEEEPLRQEGETSHHSGPVHSHASELPRLELYVPLLVLQNAVAQLSQHGGCGSAVQRGVVHLRENLRDDEYGDGDLEAAEE